MAGQRRSVQSSGRRPAAGAFLRATVRLGAALGEASSESEVLRLMMTEVAGALSARKAMVALIDGDRLVHHGTGAAAHKLQSAALEGRERWSETEAYLSLRAGEQLIGALWLSFAKAPRATREVRTAAAWLSSACAQALVRARLACERNARNATLLQREREARGEAERLNRLKDEFVARVAHELRTPAASAHLWLELLRIGDEASARPALSAIGESLRAQNVIIDDLMDVARGIAGKLRIAARPLDFRAIVAAAVAEMRPRAEAAGVRTQVELPDAPAIALVDERRARQIVTILLANALKFTPAGGRVTLRLEASTEVELSVSDTGVGMTAPFLERIFAPFSQEGAGPGRHHDGLGLGLSIAQQLVLLHGGSIAAHSEGTGRGALFKVTLPRALSEAAPSASPSAPPLPDIGGREVLIVEDDELLREAIAAIVRNYGARARTARSAEEAMESIEERPPDVILCDIGLPGEPGDALIRRIRTHRDAATSSIPAVALTAYVSPENRRRAILAGFSQHVAKPVQGVAILHALALALWGFELQRQRRPQ